MHSPIKTNVLQKNKHKKLKPGLVASYELLPMKSGLEMDRVYSYFSAS